MKAQRKMSQKEEEKEGELQEKEKDKNGKEEEKEKEKEEKAKEAHLGCVVEWLRKTFCIGTAGSILKAAVFQEYKRFCRASGTIPVSPTVFGRFVRKGTYYLFTK